MGQLGSGMREFVAGLGKGRSRKLQLEVQKLQLKALQAQMAADEKAQQAKSDLVSMLAQGFSRPQEVAAYDQKLAQYSDVESDEQVLPVSAVPTARPGTLTELLATPQGQATFLQSGYGPKDLQDVLHKQGLGKEDILEILAAGQTNGAVGAGSPTSGFVPQSGGLALSGFKTDTSGRPMLDFQNQFDPYKQAQAERDAAKLYFETGIGGPQGPSASDLTPKQRRELEAKRVEEKPKDLQSLRNVETSLSMMENDVQALLSHPGLNWATGIAAPLGKVPGTDARGFDAKLNTLKSKVAIAAIQEMRAASKTGGAVGQVSEAEWPKLESKIATLDSNVKTPELVSNLNDILEWTKRQRQLTREAYRGAYGELPDQSAFMPRKDGQVPAGLPPGSQQIGTSNGKPVYQAPDGKRYLVE